MLNPEGLWKSIAVPSRLYAQKSKRLPLAGTRVSVKDNFKLAGIKTTMTNRAFTELYPADEDTAEYIETLRNLGAVIVGKSKMSSFAAGENPGDWIDFPCPFNPRGDQYQSPGSSSAGAAAALAAYPWLDYSVGTDSGNALPNTTRLLSNFMSSRGQYSCTCSLQWRIWTETLIRCCFIEGCLSSLTVGLPSISPGLPWPCLVHELNLIKRSRYRGAPFATSGVTL